MTQDYIFADRLAVGYGRTPIIEDISLHVRRGQIVTLIGPNGAGKSTILRTVIRRLKPMGGAVWLDGMRMETMAETDQARRMSAMMTDRISPELMTCRDVVAMGRYPYTGRLGILSARDWQMVEDALKLVGGTDLELCLFDQLSDGQRQRILLARAVCQEPEVIVLDEPTSFLDIRHKLELLTILKNLVRERQVAVLMSLHELDLAQKISDWVVCVERNAVGPCGLPEEIFTAGRVGKLYGITSGSYEETLGLLEMEPVKGKPKVFVIGGGGGGIPVYRRLWRQGIPFAAGVLHENDLDFPVARALAVEVAAEKAFCPIGEEAFLRALSLAEDCGQVICCAKEFGPMNERNRELAEKMGAVPAGPSA